jgi:hypothetical protein
VPTIWLPWLKSISAVPPSAPAQAIAVNVPDAPAIRRFHASSLPQQEAMPRRLAASTATRQAQTIEPYQ